MNGIICVNKPQNFTSFDVIAKLRGILQTRKLGHGGTLDPMAVGVLPVFIGNAAKACDIMPDNTKSYRAGFRLGFVSDTQDITGKIRQKSDIPIKENTLLEIFPQFIGKIQQIPPMYSAVQINGKRLYDLARQGIVTERQPREIEIKNIKLLNYDEEKREGTLEITCGKGTYIRTIINDIGEKAGCGGIMTSLVRTSSGGFTLDDCYTIEQIQQSKDENRIDELVIPIERVFSDLPKIKLNEIQSKMYRNGVKLDLQRLNGIKKEYRIYSVYGNNGNFIGTAEADFKSNLLRIGKNLG